jgi:hypothetical protein
LTNTYSLDTYIHLFVKNTVLWNLSLLWPSSESIKPNLSGQLNKANLNGPNRLGFIQSDQKVMQLIPDMFYLSKNKFHWNQKTKINVILSVGNAHAFSDACIHSFPHVWCNLAKSSCVTEMVPQTRYCRFVWHRRIGKCIPKLILAN